MASFLDRDKDGKVTQRDFDIMLKQSGKKGLMPKMMSKLVFNALDRNGDGQIDSKELKGINFKGLGKQGKPSKAYKHEQNYAPQMQPHSSHSGPSRYSDYSNPQPGGNYSPQHNQYNDSHSSFSNQGPSRYSPTYNDQHANFSNPSSGYPSGAPHNPYNDYNSSYLNQGPSGYPSGSNMNNHPGYPTGGGGMPMPMPNMDQPSYPGPGYNAGQQMPLAYNQNNNYPGYGQNQSSGSGYPPPHNPYL